MTVPYDMAALTAEVVAYTIDAWGSDCRALYAYGSFVTSEMDSWSDLDLCMIEGPGCDDERLRAWQKGVQEMCKPVIDGDVMSLRSIDIGEDAPWNLALSLIPVKEQSRLLVGEDVRAAIHRPSAHKIRLAVGEAAMLWTRRLNAWPAERALPDKLRELEYDPAATFSGRHNRVWEIATGVLHFLRAIAYLQWEKWFHTKREIREHFADLGDDRCVALFDAVFALRKTVPCVGPVTPEPEGLATLRRSFAELHKRVMQLLQSHGLEDPSYKPDGKVIYAPDGALATHEETP